MESRIIRRLNARAPNSGAADRNVFGKTQSPLFAECAVARLSGNRPVQFTAAFERFRAQEKDA